MDIKDRGYFNPEVLVSTNWVEENLSKESVRLVESNEDQLLYRSGHIQSAAEIDWIEDLNHPLRRDYLNKDHFESLMKKTGISPDTTVVFYGDKSNWWAAYAFWVFKLFGHKDCRLMDGGRLKWVNEGRELTKDVKKYPETSYQVSERDDSVFRVFRDDVLQRLKSRDEGSSRLGLVDVRSPEEFSGERLHMPDYPNEGALRGGHIPGAKSIPWAKAVNDKDGTFRSADELKELYQNAASLSPDEEVIVYCRIGERSSHTWFALTYLLGFENAKNYDGSWTEWGNLVGVPVEK